MTCCEGLYCINVTFDNLGGYRLQHYYSEQEDVTGFKVYNALP